MKPYHYAIAVLIFLAATSPSQGDEITRYKGEIRPLEQPVLVRYRPYPKSPYTFTQTNSAQDSLSHSTTTGYSKVVAEGDFLLKTIEINVMQSEASGQTQETDLGLKMRIRMSERGDILAFDVDAPPEIASLTQGLMNAFKSMIPSLPEQPVDVGDTLYDLNSTFNVQGRSIRYILTARIAGSTQYRGRSALVVNYEGTFSGGGKMMDISGYGLEDVTTGEWVLSDLLIHNQTVQIRLIAKIDLPPIAPRARVIAPQISPSGNVERRLQELKRLLDKGLITPDEAAEKRKEILSSL